MLFYPNERTVIFIDGPNHHGAMRGLDWEMDFALLKKHFAKMCHLIRVYYFTAIFEEKWDALRTMLDYLDYNGYTVVTKAMKTLNAHDDEMRMNIMDGGRLYFWIREEHLKAGRFDNVWMMVDCY